MSHDISKAACVGMHWLFESTDIRDHEVAKRICDTCPAITACKALLQDVLEQTRGTSHCGGGPQGTWAGELVGGRGPLPPVPRRPAACGTDSGYFRHRRSDEEACDPCKAAHAAVDKAARRRQRVSS